MHAFHLSRPRQLLFVLAGAILPAITLLAAVPGAVPAAGPRGAVPGAVTPSAIAPASSLPVPATTKPATKPALPTATRASATVQADALLGGFPRNAPTISGRTDARAMTIEGRVRDVRTVSIAASGAVNPSAASEVRVVLVGKWQAGDFAPHFTCHMDKTTAEEAAKLTPDTLIRLTGAVGGVTAGQDRIDLVACHDLTVLGDATLGQRILGKWTAPLRQEPNTPAEMRGNSLTVDIAFAGDNTFAEQVLDGSRPVRQVTGKWSVIKGKDDGEEHLKFDLKGMPLEEKPAYMDDTHLVFTPPGLPDLYIAPKTTASKMLGTDFNYDARGMADQVMKWFNANLAPANAPPAAQAAGRFIDNAVSGGPNNQWYYIDVAGGNLTNNRTTQLLVCNAKFFVLPYTDAQTRRSTLKPRDLRFGNLTSQAVLLVPEARIESITLDTKSTLFPSKPLTGKVVFRTLGRQADAQYVVIMTSVHGTLTSRINKEPGPDPDTFDFSFDVNRAGSVFNDPDPLAVVFSIGRIPRPDDRTSDRKPRMISEPFAQLMDISK